MSMTQTPPGGHSHTFLGEGHEQNERRTWLVIWLCGFMMVGEIVAGLGMDENGQAIPIEHQPGQERGQQGARERYLIH